MKIKHYKNISKPKLKRDLMDEILIDLYEQGAFNFYKRPSSELTGDVLEENKKEKEKDCS